MLLDGDLVIALIGRRRGHGTSLKLLNGKFKRSASIAHGAQGLGVVAGRLLGLDLLDHGLEGVERGLDVSDRSFGVLTGICNGLLSVSNKRLELIHTVRILQVGLLVAIDLQLDDMVVALAAIRLAACIETDVTGGHGLVPGRNK